MIARSSFFLFGCSLVLAFALTDLRDAEACGGCFHPPPTTTRGTGTETTSVITDHRMVFKIASNETILWDQVRYTGAPEEFAWVLPVREGATIELSHDEFIASLDAVTKTTIKGPTRVCTIPNSSGQTQTVTPDGDDSGGCGSTGDSDFASASRNSGADAGAGSGSSSIDAGTENENVEVVSQAVIGPYESVTLRAKDDSKGDVAKWLRDHDFEIPTGVKPIIDAYTAEGFDFIALRLRPGAGVQAMRPVRVVTPGADTSMPLRMVTAGIGAKVGLTLWVVGEGRYEAQNFPNGLVADGNLRWNAKISKSNYSDIEEELFAGSNGRTWVTEASGPQSFDGNATNIINGAFGLSTTVYSAYNKSCLTQPPHQEPCDKQLGTGDAGAGVGVGGGGGAGDGGADADGGVSTKLCLVSACDGYDDLDVATRGLHKGDIWVTRLRADLPAAALSEDFKLSATSQTQVSSAHVADVYSDPNDEPCPNGVLKSSSSSSSSGSNAAPPPDDSSCTCRVQKKTTKGTWLLIAATASIAARMTRRRKK